MSKCVVLGLVLILIASLVVGGINCNFCTDKKSRKLRDFDSTRRNVVASTATVCTINYFDIDSVSQLTLLDVVRNVKALRILSLSGNRIRSIDNDTFNQFEFLETLKLDDNFLDEIRSHSFNGLSELTILDLSSNLIRSIDSNAFIRLGSLLRLNLANNCLINLALKLPLVALDSLNLSRNLIENFPHLQIIGAIGRLDLSHNTNGILDFPTDVQLLRLAKSIKSLNIEDNELSNLTQLQLFINLDELNLADNPIDYHAEENLEFTRLIDLKKLNISGTNLTSLGIFDSANCYQFTTLSLERNPLRVDFWSLVGFSKLRRLRFSSAMCHEFHYHWEIRNNFQHLSDVTIHFDDTSTCECVVENKKLLSMHGIKLSTDCHPQSSGGIVMVGVGRLNGVICSLLGLIVLKIVVT